MSFPQQQSYHLHGSHAPAQRDVMRAMLVAAAFDDSPRLSGSRSPDSAVWSSGTEDGACEDILNDKPVLSEQQSGGRKRSADSPPDSERLAKHAKYSPCNPNVDTDPSPSSAEASPNLHSCPAWEGLGKGFLDLALGLVAPLDASCPRVTRASFHSLSDQERMQNAVRMFNRELDQRLGSIA